MRSKFTGLRLTRRGGRVRVALLCAGLSACIALVGAGSTKATATPTYEAVSAGGNHTCAITSDGGVQCWGSNSDGQLGNGTTTDSSSPVDVAAFPTLVTNISAGPRESCVVMSNGGARCWGDNVHGQLGDGTTTDRSTPVDVTGLSGGGAVQIATSGDNNFGDDDDEFTCVVMSGGVPECWGSDDFEQLGNLLPFTTSSPTPVAGLTGVVAVATGGREGCALTSGGAVSCWGGGYLGNGTTDNSPVPVPVTGLSSGVTAISIGPGSGHNCVLTSGGGVECWGQNVFGEVGNGTNAPDVLSPAPVSGLSSGVTAITTGGDHSCALTSGGAVKCWGSNSSGELGDGTTTGSHVPVQVSGLTSGVVAISAGGAHTCALLSDGTIRCWGDNSHGQLGNGTTTGSLTPVTVTLDNDLSIASVSDITAAATSSAGAAVTFTKPSASDEGSETPSVSCDHASGDTFPLGSTTVTCTATDSDDNPSSVQTSFKITVTDSDLKLTNVPANMTVPATSSTGAVVTYTKPTATDEEGAPAVTCSPASGSRFSIGATSVSCSASDADDSNSPVTAGFTVNVKGADAQLQDLVTLAGTLPPGTSLLTKAQAALADFKAGDIKDACSLLTQVIKEAQAQSGKHLTAAQANEIIVDAKRIQAVIGC